MPKLDVGSLAQELEDFFGLELVGDYEEVEGGIFASLRPISPAPPNGFTILISRTSRYIEASLRLDNQAGALVRDMASADNLDKGVFVSILSSSASRGVAVKAIINSSGIEEVESFPEGEWGEVFIECSSSLPHLRASGDVVYRSARAVAQECFSLVLCLLDVEPADVSAEHELKGYPEGGRVKIEVNRYERNPLNRIACLNYYGVSCQACGFNFEDTYGRSGAGYVQVHHVTPLSRLGAMYRVDPIEDLIPLCANCHAMAHRRDPSFTVEEIRQMILQKSSG